MITEKAKRHLSTQQRSASSTVLNGSR